MTANHRKGCFSRLRILTWGILLFIATMVQIASGWDEFSRKMVSASADISSILTGLISWFVSSTSIPRWMVTLILILVLWNLNQFRFWLAKIRNQSNLQRARFREMWLFFHTDPNTNLPIVVNRNWQEARCGVCMGSIVSTDAGQYGSWVRFLKCENGHFVGGIRSHDEYQKELEISLQQDKQERLQGEEQAKKLINDLEEGRITQDEFDRIAKESGKPHSRGGYFILPDPPPPASASEFYDQIVREFEQMHVRKELEKIKIIDLENPN